MHLPLIIAHGELIIPIFFIGIPSLITGVILLIFATFEEWKQTDVAKKNRKWALGISGFILIAVGFISPLLGPPIYWLLERVDRLIIG